MYYLYLDESGDLGFDFQNKRPSSFFTITILVVKGAENNRHLLKAADKTIKRKIRRKDSPELKGSHTSLEVKKYFFDLIKDIDFEIYALTLNKVRVYEDLINVKDRLYNFLARLVIDRIPLDEATRIDLIVDKSKTKSEIVDFNNYIINQLKSCINPIVPLNIFHYSSHENKGIQAVDLFSWGIFRKYERRDYDWYKVFDRKIRYDGKYL